MGNLPKGKVSTSSLYTTMLREVVSSGVESDVLLYSYHRSFNGFAAKLTKDEADKLREKDGVVSVFLSQKMQLHTTRSWDFMGFSKKVLRSAIESDIIVGMLDTGIWPESQSFNDTGFGPIPKKWKGTCQSSDNFTCNKKIIGAKYYKADGDYDPDYDIQSPRDSEGHGSHTSSTAAGAFVSKASLYGLAKGTARAFDDAIADGVDIISLSVGSSSASDYFDDPIAIGTFHSMKNGILTSNSAGNSGPVLSSISNLSPWSLSVAASTIDRKFVTNVKLGNGEIYEGTSINTFDLDGKMYPFIAGAAAPNTSQGYTSEDSRYCDLETLDKTLVEGKILFCDYDSQAYGPVDAGAVGAVFQNSKRKDYVFPYGLPLSNLNLDDGRNVFNYVNTTENPTATIFKTQVEDNQFAPFVVSFSSRGPNPVTADILKPDLAAPGVDILAAWSEIPTLTDTDGDTRIVPYNIVSGTSMACPHATGAATYVKSFHPTWSPAAIKSALMTTAFPMSSENNLEAEFAYGAGHINPAVAVRPGLIYDAGEIDFVNFLCGQGYNPKQLALLTASNSTCSEETKVPVWDLNYPSFALSTTPGNSVTRVFHRTVTNVGSAVSTYKAVVKAPSGLVIQVQPSVISFKSLGQKQSYTVTVGAEVGNSMISGALIWDDGVHQVRSPIVAYASLLE
ncbi:Cucumisin [Hibiscus syriacus]|uniref:Cucumisin n=1 Tax=Hibiscus syriacus TaxID=106335 RepID=A0A6A3BPN4_HIBSY|nr:Cucumisin [Hibiscus syriacus]